MALHSVKTPAVVSQPSAQATSAQDEIQRKRIRILPTHGVAVFDNETQPSSGWACSCGGEPFYFSSVQELPSDVIWVASADFTAYQRDLKQYHNLRRADYLHTSVLRLASDLGCRVEGHHARMAAKMLSSVVHGAIEIAASAYEIEVPIEDLREDVLHEDIRKKILKPPHPKAHLASALSSAYQGSSSPHWPSVYDEGSISLTLRMNRFKYFSNLLRRPLPDEGWTVDLRGEDFVRAGLTMEALLDPSRPCLVEATIDFGNQEPDLATLAAFGVQAGKKLMLRKWISQPELAWLSRIARVHIQTAFVCQSTRSLPPSALMPAKLTADPLYELSLSAGLIAQCHYQALASETWNAKKREKSVTAWAVWLRAYDRAEMFKLSLKALRAGFQPIAYGGGAITVKFNKSRLPELLEFALENDIAHPMLHPLFVEHGYAQDGQPLALAA